MIEVKRIFPECFSDTLLVELIVQRGKPAHYKGISKVAKILVDHERDDMFMVGLADTDKFKRDSDNPNLQYFSILDDRINTEGLLILHKNGTNKYLIRLHPAFEQWIWDRAAEAEVSPAQYGFNSLADLIKAAKDNEVSENLNLKRFIQEVVKRNPPAVKTLRRWLIKVLPQEQQDIILSMID